MYFIFILKQGSFLCESHVLDKMLFVEMFENIDGLIIVS